VIILKINSLKENDKFNHNNHNNLITNNNLIQI
jgi:hypothetical protein